MRNRRALGLGLAVLTGGLAVVVATRAAQQEESSRRQPAPPPDAIAEAQTPRKVAAKRPEQKKTEHDRSGIFAAPKAPESSPALEDQPEKGQITGFDFARDPLNAKRPMQTSEEIMKEDVATKPKVMAAQRKLLESRYNLEPKLDPEAKMSRGKPLAVGPTARLAEGMTWEKLAEMTPDADPRGGRVPLPAAAAPEAHDRAGRCSRRCRSRCSPGWSGSTSISTCPRRSCPSSRRPSFCRTAPSWATCRAARWSRSTTSTRCSRTS